MKRFILACLLCLFIPTIALAGMVIQTVASGADWTNITLFYNFEGSWADPTYTLAASERGTDTTLSETGTVDITNGAAKIGSNGLYVTDNASFLRADISGNSELNSDEGAIGFWFQASSWDDGCMVMRALAGSDYIAYALETDNTNEFRLRWYNTGNDCLPVTTGTTLAGSTWYFLVMSWNASTDLLRVTVSSEAAGSEGDLLDSNLGCTNADVMDSEPSTFDMGSVQFCGGPDTYIDNVIVSSSSSKDIWSLRNETSD